MSNPEITEDQRVRYLAHEGARCPYCGSIEIEGICNMQVDGPGASMEIECSSCGRSWYDIYTLTGVEPKED